MLRYCFVFVIFFFLSLCSIAQSIDKAFGWLEDDNYDKAKDAFSKSISKKKNIIAAKYGLALLFSDYEYPKKNYSKAYRYFNYVEKKLNKLDEGDKSKLDDKYSINQENISLLKEALIDSILLIAKQSDDEAELKKFLVNYKDTHQAVQVWDSIHKSIVIPGNMESYIKLLDIYPTHPYKSRFWMDLYKQFTFDGEYQIFVDFSSQYPDFPYKDTLIFDMNMAKFAEDLKLSNGVRENRQDFKQYVMRAAPRELAFVALQRLLDAPLSKRDWEASKLLIDSFAGYFPDDDPRIIRLNEILNREEDEIEVKDFSDKINTDAHEFAPCVSADGNYLYFCGFARSDNIGGEDIFVSERVGEGWSSPNLIPNLNNQKGNEAPEAISIDRNTIVIFASGDLFYSNRTKTGWSSKKAFENVNIKNYWDGDAVMGSDGKSLLFASDRPGGIGKFHKKDFEFHGYRGGNMDIYVSLKDENGWSEPINIGKDINTPYCDRSPFLHPDMKTLYFSSDGHASLGRLDVYKSTRLYDTSWTHWSEPINLGRQINTPNDDWGYKISTDGATAYFAALVNRNFDLVYVELPESMRPENVVVIKGKLTDIKGQPVNATIKWENLETGEIIGETNSDPVDGTYLIILPMGKNYGFFIDNPEYFPVSGNIDLRNQENAIETINDITLNTINELKSGKVTIRLKNIFFDHDKDILKPASHSELNRLIGILKKYGHLRIEIAGHTDITGTAAYNVDLSDRRANAVMRYLIDSGVGEERLSAKGYGQSQPVDTNDTEEGRANNRRVEIRFK